MINRITLYAAVAVLAILAGALVVQSLRVAGLETDLAVKERDLDAATTRISLLEESEKTLLKTRDGLTGQVEACQKANTKAMAAAQSRKAIVVKAKPVTAEKGKVVDDETNTRAARHINDALGR